MKENASPLHLQRLLEQQKKMQEFKELNKLMCEMPKSYEETSKQQSWFNEVKQMKPLFNEAIKDDDESIRGQAFADVCDMADKDIAGARQFSLDIFNDNIDYIDKSLGSSDTLMRVEALNAAATLVRYGGSRKRKNGLQILEKHHEEILENVRRNDDEEIEGWYMLSFTALLSSENMDIKRKAEETINDISNPQKNPYADESTDSLMKHLLEHGLLTKQGVLGMKILREKLSHFGLDGSDIVPSWLIAGSDFVSVSFVNLQAMRELEQERQGITQTLAGEFGIHNFNRYSTEMLIRQYDEKDKDMEYGIILTARSDHNNAFAHDNRHYARMTEDLSSMGIDMGLRVIECSDKHELARRLAKLQRKYGDRHKISFAFVNAHGTDGSIQLGWGEQTFMKDWLGGNGTQRAREYFIDNPTFVLNSCSTGAENGIGQELSKQLSAKVIAPDKPGYLEDLSIEKEGDILEFNAVYNGSKKPQTRIYTNGNASSIYHG